MKTFLRLASVVGVLALGLSPVNAATTVNLAPGSGRTIARSAVRNTNRLSSEPSRGSIQIVYVSDRTHNRVLIYLANEVNPIGSITQGIVEVGGLAVDQNGNLYVANGSGGNVLEFAPGGAGPIRTYTMGLRHPVNVTLDSGGNMYVAEQAPSSIVEYAAASPAHPKIYPLPHPNDPVRGVAVDLAGDILASTSGIGDSFPLHGNCLSVSEFYVIPFGTTTPILKALSSNEQAFGLAVDAAGTLYASDPCLNNVAVYSLPKLAFEGYLRYASTFNQPFYLTIANGYISVPSAGEGIRGYVTIVKMHSQTLYYSLGDGSHGEISAVVGWLPK